MDFALIVDCGSYTTKFAGQAKRNRRKDWGDGKVKEIPSVGDAADAAKSSSTSCAPTRWQQSLARVVEKEVQQDEELTLTLLMDTFAPRRLREDLFQYAFEHVGAKKVAMCYTAATALFGAGTTSGVSVDVGYNAVHITPVERGVPLPWLSTSLAHVGCAASDKALHACLAEASPGKIPDFLSSAFQTYLRDPAFQAAKSTLLSNCNSSPSATSLGDEENGRDDPAVPTTCRFLLPDGATVAVRPTPELRSRVVRPMLYSDGCDVPASFASAFQKFYVEFPPGADAPQWACFGGGAVLDDVPVAIATGLSGSPFPFTDKRLSLRNPRTAAVDGALILTHLNSFKGMCVSVAEYQEDGPSQCVHVKTVDAR